MITCTGETTTIGIHYSKTQFSCYSEYPSGANSCSYLFLII